jgi:hypothetical protein
MPKLHWRGWWRCILLTHQLELFFVFVGSNVVHFAKLVDLSQGQASLAQVSQLRLAVVLRQVLICFRLFFEKFVENHTGIYTGGGAAAPGPTGATAPASAGPPAAAGSMPAISSPAATSPSSPPGVIPTPRRS